MAGETFETLVASEAKKLIMKQIEELKEQMSFGFMSEREYNMACGRVQGMRETFVILEKAETNVLRS
jgi:hypothetical protein